MARADKSKRYIVAAVDAFWVDCATLKRLVDDEHTYSQEMSKHLVRMHRLKMLKAHPEIRRKYPDWRNLWR
jgi:hypothetical protein